MAPTTATTAAYPYVLPFTVRPDDDLWRIVRDNLRACGYPDIGTFAADVRAENPSIGDWQAVEVGSVINLPSATPAPAQG